MNNELQIFSNSELGVEVRIITNDDGSISLNAEDTAKGFGWTYKRADRGNKEFIRWNTINEYLKELGMSQEVATDDYIPESLFYMLGMKASNETAKKYQRWLAIDVIPSIRKTGTYNANKSTVTYTESLQGTKLIADDLKVNDGSRILMYNKVCKSYGVDTAFLPTYTDEKLTKSLTILLKEHDIDISTKKSNILLLASGYLKEKTRPSTKKDGKKKKYKQLTDKGLLYGKNLISPHNQKETQPHYYEDTFIELVKKVLN